MNHQLSNRLAAWVVVLIMGAAFVSAFLMLTPNPAASSQSEHSFSAERTLQHLEKICEKPHPIGTSYHDSVRHYLTSQIQKMGYQSIIQDTMIASAFKSRELKNTTWARVQNIITHIKGIGTDKKTIVFMAHYDSDKNSLGAGDDGAAVCSMLECMRVLNFSGEIPAHDIYFVMTDAEEDGLMGAQAFLHEYLKKQAPTIDLVINFEARGVSGVNTLFQMSAPNGLLIHEIKKAIPHISTNSLTASIYERMPNDTDLTVFLNDSIAGINIAFFDKGTHYHTILDNPREINPKTIQQQGDYMLALLRHFGQSDWSDLNFKKGHREVFFTLPFVGILHYPTDMALSLSGIIVFFYLIFLVLAIKQKQISFVTILTSKVTILFVFAFSGGLGYGLWKAILWLHPSFADILQGDTYNSVFYFGGGVAFITGLVGLLCYTAMPYLNLISSMAVMIGVLMVVNFVSASHFVDAHFISFVPSVLMVVMWTYLVLRNAWSSYTMFDALIVGSASAVCVVFFVPQAWNIYSALTMHFLWLAFLIWAQMLICIAPVIRILVAGFRLSWVWLCMLAGVGLLLYGELNSSFDSKRKKPDSILYALDADTHKGYWISFDDKPDDFTKQFLGENAQKDSTLLGQFLTLRKAWHCLVNADAPPSSLVPAEVKMKSRYKTKDSLVITLDVKSLQKAETIDLILSDSLSAYQILLNGSSIAEKITPISSPRHYIFKALGASFQLTFVTAPDQKIAFQILERKYGLEGVWKKNYSFRKPILMPKTYIPTDMVLTKKQHQF